MQVYQTDHSGFYVGPVFADPDPLDAGNWLIPAGCVTDAPPALGEGQRAKFDSGAWFVVDPEPKPEPEPSPPPPPEPVPDLTFAQLMIGLVSEGWITTAEGEAWLTGTLPAPVLTLIGTLPAGQQFAAKARALRPTVVERADPLVSALGAAQGKSPEQLDTFFQTYAAI
jgi:hypothetical protein